MPAQVAFVDCEDAAKWADHLEIFRDAFASQQGPGEPQPLAWRRYRACAGELPSAAELAALDAIVVPGSHHSAVPDGSPEGHPRWMLAVMDLLRRVVRRGRPRLFCACFGHQLLAAAMGGEVRQGGSFVFKAEDVELGQPWHDWAGEADLQDPPSELRIIESHGDFVAALPPGAVALGGSASCRHELFAMGPSVLSCQGHMEFDAGLVRRRILPALREGGRLTPEEEAAAQTSLDAPMDISPIRHLVRQFLVGPAAAGARM